MSKLKNDDWFGLLIVAILAIFFGFVLYNLYTSENTYITIAEGKIVNSEIITNVTGKQCDGVLFAFFGGVNCRDIVKIYTIIKFDNKQEIKVDNQFILENNQTYTIQRNRLGTYKFIKK